MVYTLYCILYIVQCTLYTYTLHGMSHMHYITYIIDQVPKYAYNKKYVMFIWMLNTNYILILKCSVNIGIHCYQ